MIRIGKPYVTETDSHVRLNADIAIDAQGSRTLWIEVEKEYGKAFRTDRADAFFLGTVCHAMRFGHDIVCEAPITDRLYDQIVETFLPLYWRTCEKRLPEGKRPKPFKVVAGRIAEEPATGTIVGAGVSCGVDSLHVFASKGDITHGFVWNMWAWSSVQNEAQRQKKWTDLRNRAREFTDSVGIPLVVVTTNYDTGLFPQFQADAGFSWANLFILHALRPMLRKYYFASSDGAEEFRLAVDPWDFDSYYEAMLLPYASLSGLRIQLIGGNGSRFDKYRTVADYAPARKLLSVCWIASGQHAKNCTLFCSKCRYTVLGLNALGLLDRFGEVFDLDLFRRQHDEFLLAMLSYARKENEMRELLPYYRQEITFRLRVIHLWRTFLRRLFGIEKQLLPENCR